MPNSHDWKHDKESDVLDAILSAAAESRVVAEGKIVVCVKEIKKKLKDHHLHPRVSVVLNTLVCLHLAEHQMRGTTWHLTKKVWAGTYLFTRANLERINKMHRP